MDAAALDIHDSQRSFNDDAVLLLYKAFPSENFLKGQLYDRWVECNQYLHQVLNLRDRFLEESSISQSFKAPWEFCHLLSSCQRFLSEKNEMNVLERVCETNLQALAKLEDGPKKADLQATILSHQAQAAESLGDPIKAIELNKKAYELRLHEEPRRTVLLCYTANNLGYCHDTANLHEDAEKWFKQSAEWWETMVQADEETRDQPAQHIANLARCLVYLGKNNQAKERFGISIYRLKTEKPFNWAMLAYALFGLATLNRRQQDFETAEAYYIEAQSAWLKGGPTSAHPFLSGCLYKVGVCCLDQGKFEAAIKHLRDSLEITKVGRLDRPVEHARTLFQLSKAILQDSTKDGEGEAMILGEEAENILRVAKPGVTSCATEDAYDDFVPIFWR